MLPCCPEVVAAVKLSSVEAILAPDGLICRQSWPLEKLHWKTQRRHELPLGEANSECCWHTLGGKVCADLFVPVNTHANQSNTNHIKTNLPSVHHKVVPYTYIPMAQTGLMNWQRGGELVPCGLKRLLPGPLCPQGPWWPQGAVGPATMCRMHQRQLLTFHNDATKKKLPLKVKFGKNEFLQA